MVPPLASGRREADQLLLLLLRQNGCAVPKGISSVAQMTSDVVIQVVGSLIPGIDGSPPVPEAFSTRGLHPAERHRACKIVASRVKDAGYTEPLSAQQLLYPGEGATRKLLLTLLSMLPPDGAPLTPSQDNPNSTREQGELAGGDLLSGNGDDGPAPNTAGSANMISDNSSSTVADGRDGRSEEGKGDDSSVSAEAGEVIAVPEESAHDPEDRREDQGDGQSNVVEESSGDGGVSKTVDTGEEGENKMPPEDERKSGDTSISQAEEGQGGLSEGTVRGKAEQMARALSPPDKDSASTPLSEGTGEELGISSEKTSEDVPIDVEAHSEVTAPFGGDALEDEGGGAAEVVEDDEEEQESNIFAQEVSTSMQLEVDDDPPVDHDAGLDTSESDNVFAQGGASRVGFFGGVAESEAATADDHDSEQDSVDRRALIKEEGGIMTTEANDIDGGSKQVNVEAGFVGFKAERVDNMDDDSVSRETIVGREQDDGTQDTAGEPGHVAADLSTPGDEDNGYIEQTEHRDIGSELAAVIDEAKGDGRRRDDKIAKDDSARIGSTVGAYESGDPSALEPAQAAPDQYLEGTAAAGNSDSVKAEQDGFSVAAAEQGLEQGERQEGVSGLGPVEIATDQAGGEDEDVVFLQFAVEAQELELKRLLKEHNAVSATADELEAEVARLGVQTEERERTCRHSAKALELLPRAAEAKAELQGQCSATETRMQAARRAFDRTRKPLEDTVRAQREELARRKARCRSLLTEMRSIYQECERMTRSESSLRAAATAMEAWETTGHTNESFLIGGGTEVEGAVRWEDKQEEEEDVRRRKSGALLRADLDGRISSLCEQAMAHKQEVAISISEVLDARRETDSAWQGLGRSEALAEEKLFAVTKEATAAGGSKERARDLVQLYKNLHRLVELFGELVEAVSESGKRQEECRALEDDTDALLAEGETVHMERLMVDLRRVQEDASVLEKRLDDALEDERELRRAYEAEKRLQDEQEALLRDQVVAREEDNNERSPKLVGSDGVRGDESVGIGFEREEVGDEQTEGGMGEDETRKDDVGSVDFAGEDDDENVWQQVNVAEGQG